MVFLLSDRAEVLERALSTNKKGKLTPEAQHMLDTMLHGIERDMRDHIIRMSPEELNAYIEEERQEATVEQFADFMKFVLSVVRSKSN